MKREEILEKTQNKKAVVGEMEKQKISRSAVIATIVICVFAIAFIIAEGVLGHFSAVFAIASLCLLWPTVFYALQYFLAKRPWQVLIGSVLNGLAAIFFFIRYILCVTGIWL